MLSTLHTYISNISDIEYNPIHKPAIPVDRQRDIMYFNPVCREKINDGKIKRRVRGTIGGDRINYPGSVLARIASLEVVRTLINSVLADDADFMTADITDYYLGTPLLLRQEYVRIATKNLSATIMEEFGLVIRKPICFLCAQW